MIWKIENIEDNDDPIDKSIMENALEMVMSLSPGIRVSQTTCYQIIKLIKDAEREQGQGSKRNRNVRNLLREAYRLLSLMNCKRCSVPDKHKNTTVRRKTWAQNYLDESLSKLL